MRVFLFCLYLVMMVTIAGRCQAPVSKSKKYAALPAKFLQRDSLISYVTPDKNYGYWEFDDGEMDTTKSGRVIFSRGQRPPGLVIKDPRGYLFSGCLPAFCYKYIAYVLDGKVGYITDNNAFVKFMGGIDNLGEAILLAEIMKGVYPDASKKGGSWLKTKGGYELILTKYILCPEAKEAIEVTIDQNEIKKTKSRGLYTKPGGCAMI